MNQPWMHSELTAPDFGTDQWRQRLVLEHLKVGIRQQQRARFLGQLFLVAALIAIGAILFWAAQSLGLDLQVQPGAMRTGTIIATALLAVAGLVMAIFLWDSRLRLERHKLELLKRDLDRHAQSSVQ